jgi:hypothetical protein
MGRLNDRHQQFSLVRLANRAQGGNPHKESSGASVGILARLHGAF